MRGFSFKPLKIKRTIYPSLYVLIPVIMGGITILSFIVGYRFEEYVVRVAQKTSPLIYVVCALLVIASGIIGFIITMVFLKPLNRFLKEAHNSPLIMSEKKEENYEITSSEDLRQVSEVFEQVAHILTSVEAQELFPEIVGASRKMRDILGQIIKIAASNSTVLIYGESGTGKELVAESIYRHSPRKGKPFVKLSCVAIPEGLLESELFGHEKGAFTGAVSQKKGKFELADGGTIFLDEIGDMPLTTQAKLLRVLQEREFERVGGIVPIKVDVRFIAATNKSLVEMTKQGLFREDLLYRLQVFVIELPPLRERREDIPLLVDNILGKSQKMIKVSPQAFQSLIAYSWPGNVRELFNTIERAAVMAEKGEIELRHLPAYIRNDKTETEVVETSVSLDERLSEMEKNLVIDALVRTGGIQVKAAQMLGINQRSLWHRIKKLHIDVNALKHIAEK